MSASPASEGSTNTPTVTKPPLVNTLNMSETGPMRFVRFISFFAVSALILTGFAGAPAFAAAKTTLTLTGPSVITTGYWGPLNVNWSVNGTKQTGNIELQKKTSGTWKSVKTQKVSKGSAVVYVKPTTSGTYRVRAGDKTSKAITVESRRYYILLSHLNLNMDKGSSTSVNIKYVKNAARIPKGRLHLQHKVGGKWKQAYDVTVTGSSAKLTLKPSATKSYRLVTTNGKLTSSVFTVNVRTVVPKNFTIEGSGFGHGIGMSQYGAYQMSREGHSATKILQHYYQGSKVQKTSTPKRIAVQVYGPEPYNFSGYADSRNDTRFSVTTGRWSLRDPDGKIVALSDKHDSIKLTVQKNKVIATVDGKKYSKKKITGGEFQMRWTPSAVAKIDRANGSYKYGTLTATSINGRLNIINDLKLNTEYLYGIAEMPSSWGLNSGGAALEAQAITARSYALVTAGVNRKAKCNCDIVDDVRDQNFTGWNKAGEVGGSTNYGAVWRSAVDATVSNDTSAQTLTYAGRPIATYYFSSSGGRTANSEDVWSSKLNWARSVNDRYSLDAPGNSMKTWTRSLSQSRAQSLFGVTDIMTIKVTAEYSSGQVKTLTATSASGRKTSITAKADRMRSSLGLPASWVTAIRPN